MMRFALVFEEVLAHAEQRTATNGKPKLLLELALDCIAGLFAHFDTSTGERPELIAFQAVQQDVMLMQGHRTGAEMKATTVAVEGNHAA